MHGDDIEDYLRHLAAAGLRPATLRLRRWQLRRVFHTTDGSVEQVTAVLANPWWQPATRASMVAAVRGYWRWQGRLEDAAGLRSPRLHEARRDACDEGALADGLADASGVDYWLLRLLCDTGLRRGEAAAVASTDVGADGWLTVEGKGGRVRRVPMPDDLAAWLASRGGWCFPSALSASGHVGEDHVYRVVRRWTGAHPHQLRHRYATRAYRASHDLRAVQRLLGHASVATTQRYVAVDDAELLACAAAAWAA